MRTIVALTVLLLITSTLGVTDESSSQQDNALDHRPWQLEEALRQVAVQDNHEYARYVAIRLAARRGKEEANRVLRSLYRRTRRSEREGGVNLFSFTTGALAIRERLQLEQELNASVSFRIWPCGTNGFPRDMRRQNRLE